MQKLEHVWCFLVSHTSTVFLEPRVTIYNFLVAAQKHTTSGTQHPSGQDETRTCKVPLCSGRSQNFDLWVARLANSLAHSHPNRNLAPLHLQLHLQTLLCWNCGCFTIFDPFVTLDDQVTIAACRCQVPLLLNILISEENSGTAKKVNLSQFSFACFCRRST